ncbi:chloride channel protein [Megalodesulfovibrio paquesii]
MVPTKFSSVNAQLRYWLNHWRALVNTYRTIGSVRWLLLGIGVGVLAGLVASLFFFLVEYLHHIFLIEWAGLHLPPADGEVLFHGEPGGVYRPWLVPVLLAATGLLTGWLVQHVIPETRFGGTDGTDGMIKAFHQQSGIIRPLAPLIKGATSILTLATGGSAGREGPISQLGAGLGSWLALKLDLSPKERRILLLTGAAGGLGAIFRAPMGGALTAIEVIYAEDFEAEAVLPSVLSSVAAYTVFALIYGTAPLFSIPQFQFNNFLELPFYLVLAMFCAATGWVYVRIFRWVKYSLFTPLADRIGLPATAALGGLLAGLLGIQFPQVLSGGFGWVEEAILGNMAVTAMLAVIFLKIVATSLTLGSGMSGGMFAPALFVGGMSGGVVGFTAHALFPDIVTQPGAFVLVGMAAFFTGVAKSPIGPIMMVCELTKGYGLLAPLMLSSALCLVFNRKVHLYENQVDNKFESPAHRSDATINILERLRVEDYYARGPVVVLEEHVSLKALTDIICHTNQLCFPVRNADGEIKGLLTMEDVRRVLFEDSLFDLILVRDLPLRPVSTLTPEDDLYTALLAFVGHNVSQIPVLPALPPAEAPDGGLKAVPLLLGMLNREDVFAAYNQAIKTMREES